MKKNDWLAISETAAPDWDDIPVTLELAKAHLRVTTDDEDTLIETYIKAAVSYVEKYTGYAIAERSFLQTWPRWCNNLYVLRWGGVDVDTIEVTYLDKDGDEQEFTDFTMSVLNGLVCIKLNDVVLPELADVPDAIRVTYTAKLETVPEDMISAILLIVGDLETKRTDTVKRLPTAVTWLLDQHRIIHE